MSDASGVLKFEKLAEGEKVPRRLITEDVRHFLCDTHSFSRLNVLCWTRRYMNCLWLAGCVCGRHGRQLFRVHRRARVERREEERDPVRARAPPNQLPVHVTSSFTLLIHVSMQHVLYVLMWNLFVIRLTSYTMLVVFLATQNYLKGTDHNLATIVSLKKDTPCPEFYAALSWAAASRLWTIANSHSICATLVTLDKLWSELKWTNILKKLADA